MLNQTIKVLIVDDHALVAKLISQKIETHNFIKVVDIIYDGAKVIKRVGELPVDIVLLDINMPNVDGLEILTQLIKKFPLIKVVIISYHSEPWVIQKAIKGGASGYLTKSADCEELVDAIFKVANGDTYFCQTCYKNLINGLAQYNTNQHFNGSGSNLTKREKEILQLIYEELTTREISEKLNISPRTVETHRKNISHKLGTKSTFSLIKNGLGAKITEVAN